MVDIPSLAKRALAVVVLIVVAVIAFRLVVAFVSAVAWIVALAVLLVAAVWAISTLRSARRGRPERHFETALGERRTPASHEDRVEAQMREIKEHLRRQRGS